MIYRGGATKTETDLIGADMCPHGAVFPIICFTYSQLLDVCQPAQLVKSHQRGISETLRDVIGKKGTVVLIAY